MSVQPLYITHFISCLILVSLHVLLFTSLNISKYLSKMMLLSRKTVSAFLSSFLVLSVTSTNGSEISANEDKAFPLANAKRSNIVGGTAVPANKYPWFAEGLLSDGSWHYGGSLVTPEYIITAAWCVDDRYFSIFSYKIGALSKDDTVQNSVHETIEVAKMTVHPNYAITTLENDFALVKLKQRSTITPVKMDQGTVSPNYPSGELSTKGRTISIYRCLFSGTVFVSFLQY